MVTPRTRKAAIPAPAMQVPAAYLKLVLDTACGADQRARETLLAACGLSPDSLDSNGAGVPFDQLAQVLGHGNARLGPGWHLRMSERLEAAIHGPLGFAALTAPTTGAALDVLVAFGGIRFPFLQFAIARDGPRCRVVILPTQPLGPAREQLLELALCGVLALLEQTAARGRGGVSIERSGPRPGYSAALAATLAVPMEFGAERDVVEFPAAWLGLACPLADPSMYRLSFAKCEELLAQRTGRTVLEAGIRQELFARCEDPPGLTELAARRHMSVRTLIRQLKQHGTSYQAILDEVRTTLATSLLRDTDLPVASIAHRVGFSDPSNFGRAFRLRQRCAPGEYRARYR